MVDNILGRVMIFGTFDVFHPGHRSFIEQAQKKGSELVIVVARDVTVKKIKQLLRNSEQVRLKVLQEAFPDLTIVLGDEQDQMKVIREYRPEMVCLGYDQVGFSAELMKSFPEIQIERLEAYEPEKYKSSKMGRG
jgi:cytidyltransferase-like protein